MDNLTITRPHLGAQPGLRGHSYSDSDTLIHRYRIDKRTPSGWLALKSHREYANDLTEAALDLFADLTTANPTDSFRIVDQYHSNIVVRSTEDR